MFGNLSFNTPAKRSWAMDVPDDEEKEEMQTEEPEEICVEEFAFTLSSSLVNLLPTKAEARRVPRTCFPTKPFHITKAMQLEIIAELQITKDGIREVADMPQRSQGWLDARKGRITGTGVGPLTGRTDWASDTPDAYLSRILHQQPIEDNVFMANGRKKEPWAVESYKRIMHKRFPGAKIWISTPGLIVSKENGIFAYSPDMIIMIQHVDGSVERLLGEIKAPYYKRYKSVKPQYNAQMHHGMRHLNLPYCDFVVFMGDSINDDSKTWIERVAFDPSYSSRMHDQALEVYYQRYLPLRVAHDLELVKPGTTILPMHISCDRVRPRDGEHLCGIGYN